ncbi:hypothetical protein ATY79_07995 [Rhizobium sp. R693]|nr:hypothetical protein ATY79_07995 [Rhizobium sp. R693]
MVIQSCVADAADDATLRVAPISGAGGAFGLIVPGFHPSMIWMNLAILRKSSIFRPARTTVSAMPVLSWMNCA